MTKTLGNTRVIVLAVVALAASFFQFGNGQIVSAEEQARGVGERFSFFTATQVFSLAGGQRARFCVGTRRPGGVPLDWTVPISNERGVLLFQLPETRSPAGDRRCVIVPRSALRIAGQPTSGRVQVAARQVVKAPLGTKSSDIIGSFEIVNGDGSIGKPVTGVLYAAFHNND